MKRLIIIVGTYHHNPLSLIRCFENIDCDIEYISYGEGEDFISCSKYVKRSYHFSTPEEAVDKLLNEVAGVDKKPTVLLSDDDIASLIDVRYDEFKENCFIFNANEAGRLTRFMNKEIQTKLAQECGFVVPYTAEFKLEELSSYDKGFPVIIRPRESINGGKKLFVCQNADELKGAIVKFEGIDDIILQEYIQKDDEIVILGATANNTTIIPGFVKKHREYLGGTTFSTVYSSSGLPPEILEACKKMISRVNYEGLWGIECLIKNDVFYFIELNLRNDATTYSLSVAGANLPVWYYSMVNKLPIPFTDSNVQVKNINSMVEFNDFLNVLKMKINPFKWIKQLRSCDCKYFYSKRDKEPYIKYKKVFLRTVFTRFFK